MEKEINELSKRLLANGFTLSAVAPEYDILRNGSLVWSANTIREVNAFLIGFTNGYDRCRMESIIRRDEIAAMAMQGLCASLGMSSSFTDTDVAECAVERADALLTELGKEPA